MKLTRTRVFATAGALLVLAGGATAVVTSVSGADSDDQPTQPVAHAITATPPDAVRTVLERRTSAVADFGLDASKAKGYKLGATDASIWIVPGENGSACLIDEEGAAVCAPAEQISARGIALIRPPLPPREYGPALAEARQEGLTGEQLRDAVSKKLADVPNKSGPATYFGYAPPGTTSVRLLDGEGETIAQTEAVDGVYDFRVANFADADPRTIQMDRGAGQEAIMSGRLPAPLY